MRDTSLRSRPRVDEPQPSDLAAPTSRLLAEHDWASTPLGPVHTWPDDLQAVVRTVLPSRVPMLVWWGPELLQVYNDAYRLLVGDKHPAALGQPAAECWDEIWDEVGPLAARALSGGTAYAENLRLVIDRSGYLEETYWTFSYSPVLGADGSVPAVLVATRDVTATVLGERRMGTLRSLGGMSVGSARSLRDAFELATATLSTNVQDLPFVRSYLVRPEHGATRPGGAELVASYGEVPTALWRGRQGIVSAVDRALARGEAVLTGLPATARDGDGSGVRPGRHAAAVALPIRATGLQRVLGVLVLGISTHRDFDDDYRSFFELVAGRVSVVLDAVLAVQAEHDRAEALAELGAAKTRFYQQVSHELRTPLTLLLGPVQELLADPGVDLPPHHRAGAEAARRAAMRLRRLVDSLLEVTQAESDGLHPQLEPTDLTELTTACIDMFRPAVSDAGLELVLTASDDVGTVQVDRTMWWHVVQNLVANAFKFTPQGTIEVQLQREQGSGADPDRLTLVVRDTGVGIPAAEVPRVLERFHRARADGARSSEGSGIGLSVVDDVARALGGTVEVVSEPGAGSTFTVTIPAVDAPRGAHRPVAVDGEEAASALAVMPWVTTDLVSGAGERATDGSSGPTGRDLHDRPQQDGTRPEALGRVLLVEDNPDMRAYVARLLEAAELEVVAVHDAEQALAAADDVHLVLSDVMLPGMSGIDLVRALRADERHARTPLVLLTARSGPEAATEGLGAGADDYVVKPFDPRELVARVTTHLELAQLRELAVSTAENRADQLRAAQLSNRRIGMATGILMMSDKITPDDAFDRLRKASQDLNRKLVDVAAEVIDTGRLPTRGA